jgi:hypothetical protein
MSDVVDPLYGCEAHERILRDAERVERAYYDQTRVTVPPWVAKAAIEGRLPRSDCEWCGPHGVYARSCPHHGLAGTPSAIRPTHP